MDKESVFELQKIDCNCNDCKYLERDREKYSSYNYMYMENGKVSNPSHRPLYGNCLKMNKPICFLANTCQLDTQKCFLHRREPEPIIEIEIKKISKIRLYINKINKLFTKTKNKMKKIILITMLALFSVMAYSQDPISNLSDEARNKIELNEKSIKSEKSEIEKHQNSMANFQVDNTKLKKLLKLTPALALGAETKDSAIEDAKNKIIENDNYIKNEKLEIEKHQKNLATLQKENKDLKKAVKQIKKM